MCNAALTHVEIQRLRDATELNSNGMIKFVGVHYTKQNRFNQFFRKWESGLINHDFSFCSQILLTMDLQCHVFPFGKRLLNVRHDSTRHFVSSPRNDVAVIG